MHILLFKAEDGQPAESAAGIASDMHIDIQGTIARTTLTQYFANTTDHWQEGIYTYPLPDNAAVDSLTMMIGNKRVIGFVHEKKQAQEIYQQAKKEGKAASLAEQHRPNIFKNKVANIPPHSIIAIELQYQYPVDLDHYTFSMRTPMAITPRYNMLSYKDVMALTSYSDQQWAQTALEDLATQTKLSNFKGGYNPAAIKVNLNPGMAISDIKSRSHAINSDYNKDENRYLITPKEDILEGIQDFTLSWEAQPSDEPIIAAYQEELEGDIYSHILILPPQDTSDNTKHAPQRQVTYILDTSGSMSGPSLRQAKKSLVRALEDLKENDFFNVVEFNSEYRAIFDKPQQANANNIHAAIKQTAELEATGGTNMLPALQYAYGEDIMNDNALRQIVFITDGAIGYEDQMIELIKEDRGRSRLFAIGIGSAPNAHLMRSFANTGRGSFTFINDLSQIDTDLSKLFKKMNNPALINMTLDLPKNDTAEMIPPILPDLLYGDPISVSLRTEKPVTKIRLAGEKNGKDYALSQKIKAKTDIHGISKIYAREKIRELETSLAGNFDQDQSIQKAITDLGIKHQIMSRFTSFVAVDEETIRPIDDPVHTVQYDPSLPRGWQEDRLEGRTASELYRQLMEQKSKEQDSLKKDINLPQTATGYQLTMLLGLLSMIAGSLLLFGRKYRKVHHA